MTKEEDAIRQHGRCCRCRKRLKRNPRFNIAITNRKATWDHPVSGEILHSGPTDLALAFLCDRCADKNRDPKWVIAFGENLKIIYHSIKDLEEVPLRKIASGINTTGMPIGR